MIGISIYKRDTYIYSEVNKMFAVYNEWTERIEAICPTLEDANFIKFAMEARYYIEYRTFEIKPEVME